MLNHRIRTFIYAFTYHARIARYLRAFSPVAITYTTETYPPVKRITAISFISTSFMLSGVLGQNMSEIVVSYLNWHWVYFILTILYLTLTFIIYKHVPESPNKSQI